MYNKVISIRGISLVYVAREKRNNRKKKKRTTATETKKTVLCFDAWLGINCRRSGMLAHTMRRTTRTTQTAGVSFTSGAMAVQKTHIYKSPAIVVLGAHLCQLPNKYFGHVIDKLLA
ncbi:hypothetical protein QE152_g2002 [Popillia japonica]|uniref:Uncharacterized protein n=1 Tax=Popillia japonica TaxID=7064 RepID=A0AAW1N494_POPJA